MELIERVAKAASQALPFHQKKKKGKKNDGFSFTPYHSLHKKEITIH